MPTTSQPAVAPGEHDGADHGVEPGGVAAAGRHGDALDRTGGFLHRRQQYVGRRPSAGCLRSAGDRRDGELVDEVVETIAAVPLDPAERHGVGLDERDERCPQVGVGDGLAG